MSFRRRPKLDTNPEQSHSFKKSSGFFSTMRISSKSKLNTDMSADKAFATLDTDGIGTISARALQLALVKDDRANRNRAVTIELSDDDMDRVLDEDSFAPCLGLIGRLDGGVCLMLDSREARR
jgi:Ca2+-binding EF-hand superfamily protein